MYRTLLLMICSTSSTFANNNDSTDHLQVNTSLNTLSVQAKKLYSGKRLLLNETDSSNATVTDTIVNAKPTRPFDVTTVEVNLTHPLDVTTFNYSILITIPTETPNILIKIHRTVTRSKDAVWATVTLTFICVLLLLAVAQSKMWKGYKIPESQGVPLPDFNERVLFRDVMEHKIKSFKLIFKKQKKKNTTEMKSLLSSSELDGEEEDIP